MEIITELHERALEGFGHLLATTMRQELAGPTPCPAWSVRELVEHTIGLNWGFAAALASADAPARAYDPRPIGDWAGSARAVHDAVRRPPPERRVRVAIIDTEATFTAREVVSAHLLDLVVHAWDLAAATGRSYAPSLEVVEALAPQADLIAALGPEGTRGMFGPVVDGEEAGWPGLLRRLGRDPGWRAPDPVTVRVG